MPQCGGSQEQAASILLPSPRENHLNGNYKTLFEVQQFEVVLLQLTALYYLFT